MKREHFLAMLEKLRKEKELSEASSHLIEVIEEKKPTDVDLSNLGIKEGVTTDDEVRDVIRETLSTKENSQSSSSGSSTLQASTDRTGVARDVTLNAQQEAFNSLVQSGSDAILIGAAGTGKTTSMKKVTEGLLSSGRIPNMGEDTKWLIAGSPGAAILSYTRKAVNNIRHAVVEELKKHTLTIHKLLEFQPEFFEIPDPAQPGGFRKTMTFSPKRNSLNPLPRTLKFLAFEEASMIPVVLYELLQDAMPHKHQEVFLGDIQQLPPTFGAGILGFKMLELETIELTTVYRQAMKSPIIRLAHAILKGNPHDFSPTPEFYRTPEGKERKRIPALEAFNEVAFDEDTGEYIGSLKFQPWQKQLEPFQATMTCIAQFKAWEKEGYYQPETDIILCPYNVEFGTIELNKGIQQYLGEKREATVHEVIAGFQKYYLAEGDRMLYDKEDCFIVSISRNINYSGTTPAVASKNLDRWGTYKDKLSEQEKLEARAAHLEDDDALDDFLELSLQTIEDRVQEASHDVVIRYAFSDEEVCLSKAAEINNLLGGNAMTVHKFQGSEAERVFIVLHNQHAKMISRELLYTAVTRAKKHLHIICEPKSFFTGVASQRIKGNTIAEKAAQFTGLKDKREQEKIAAELAEHKALRDRMDSYEEDAAARQQEELKKHEPDRKALEALESKAAPTMGDWTYNLKLGKMVQKVMESPVLAKLDLAVFKDIQSDPAEELPEIPNLGYWKLPEKTTELELTVEQKLAERLARLRAKRS